MAPNRPMQWDPKAANIWSARIIPLVLIGIVGYVTWVVVDLVCVNYLLQGSKTHAARPGAVIAILVLYFLLLFMLANTYFRLLHTVITNPGYTPRGPQWRSPAELEAAEGHTIMYGARPPAYGNDDGQGPPPSLEPFYTKDVFECEGDGRPRWCTTCVNWKVERSHHCSEIQRCVRKMDHFCPWVGGIVSETNFKFFVQFVAWAALYYTFILIVMAIFVAEWKRHEKSYRSISVNWAVTLALAAFFGLFTLGMTSSSIQCAILNTTTIENLNRKTKVWTLAIYMPQPPTPTRVKLPFSTITYPLRQANSSTTTSSADDVSVQTSFTPPRTFAILHSKPGENPFDLGPFANFKQVMGEHWYDWFLPIRYSPCTRHDRGDCDYPFGPLIDRMRKGAGIMPMEQFTIEEKPSRRRKHRRSRRDEYRSGQEHRHDEERGVKLDELRVGEGMDVLVDPGGNAVR